MKHISIVPIFNQRALFIWSTFAGIQSAAMLAIKYKTVPEEAALNIAQLNQVWQKFQPCFAFGAYADGKMIGCVHGTLGRSRAVINGLYVLPEYQKMSVGAQLLAASERAASVYTDRMELRAINNANTRKFYNTHKYNIFDPREGMCAKDISGMLRDTYVPLFFCSDAIAHRCATIAKNYDINFDAASVNQKHLPMFAYVNMNGLVDGYILAKSGTVENNVQISQLCVDDVKRHDMVRLLIANMATMNNR